MSISILSPESFASSLWAGGTTTQLFIYPENASYAQRQFLFRLSTARVDAASSVFTSLPGVSRHLMLLDGHIVINHRNHYSKTLNKFDSDSFDGGWHTTAEGTCTDFNLMLTGKTEGKITALVINPEQKSDLILPACDFFFVYAFSGEVVMDYNSTQYILPAKHMLFVHRHMPEALSLFSRGGAELLMVEVRL